LPNVLMEAAHQGLAIVSTRAAAIGEFISDGDNGLLVAPGAPDELATALARLVGDPDLRQRLASRASEIVRTRFSFESGVDWIASALEQPPFAEAIVAEALAPEALVSETLVPEARAAE
jgi:glycosyltransferase involved in cell wall biosynthesis